MYFYNFENKNWGNWEFFHKGGNGKGFFTIHFLLYKISFITKYQMNFLQLQNLLVPLKTNLAKDFLLPTKDTFLFPNLKNLQICIVPIMRWHTPQYLVYFNDPLKMCLCCLYGSWLTLYLSSLILIDSRMQMRQHVSFAELKCF